MFRYNFINIGVVGYFFPRHFHSLMNGIGRVETSRNVSDVSIVDTLNQEARRTCRRTTVRRNQLERQPIPTQAPPSRWGFEGADKSTRHVVHAICFSQDMGVGIFLPHVMRTRTCHLIRIRVPPIVTGSLSSLLSSPWRLLTMLEIQTSEESRKVREAGRWRWWIWSHQITLRREFKSRCRLIKIRNWRRHDFARVHRPVNRPSGHR